VVVILAKSNWRLCATKQWAVADAFISICKAVSQGTPNHLRSSCGLIWLQAQCLSLLQLFADQSRNLKMTGSFHVNVSPTKTQPDQIRLGRMSECLCSIHKIQQLPYPKSMLLNDSGIVLLLLQFQCHSWQAKHIVLLL
jgi:hypothetical protein